MCRIDLGLGEDFVCNILVGGERVGAGEEGGILGHAVMLAKLS